MFMLAPRHPKYRKSSPTAWEPPWTMLEALCLLQAICSQPCRCFCLRFSTFYLHSHPFLTFASCRWCIKQPTLQTSGSNSPAPHGRYSPSCKQGPANSSHPGDLWPNGKMHISSVVPAAP